MDIKSIQRDWLNIAEEDLKNELIAMTLKEINDAFYDNLKFGTGGLRGIMGVGTNRMNIYTVGKATQGLIDYLKRQNEAPTVAIAYDSRIKSELFAKTAAGVIAANGGTVHIFSELMPTPILSYAVRELKCDAGIVITASHNPAQYNGYKAYGSDGGQMTLGMADAVQSCIETVDIFRDVKKDAFEAAVQKEKAHFISDTLVEKYFDQVLRCSINPEILQETDLKVIYTPLNGTGKKPVRKILARAGLKSLTLVPEQENPDGFFRTCQKPNPEESAAFELALGIAEKTQADLLLATDPDCDRVGVAVKYGHSYRLLTGNETGCLLLNYMLSQKTAKHTLPENPVIIKTIVTSAMADCLAGEYGARVINTLTGFKYIGEQIGRLEQDHMEGSYVFGFEESCGYLPETFVRDKDAVSASLLICEMAAFYKKEHSTLLKELETLYRKHGYWKQKLLSFSFEGADGMRKMETVMHYFRQGYFADFGGFALIKTDDYLNASTVNQDTHKMDSLLLPKSDVLLFSLEKNCEIVLRPSGTEPKFKCYLTVKSNDSYGAIQMMEALECDLVRKIKISEGCG